MACFACILCFLFLKHVAASAAAAADSEAPSLIFQFGDSISDTGNGLLAFPIANAPLASPPYGDTFFRKPTGRVSDGRLLIDFLASGLGLPFLEPYLRAASSEASYLHGADFSTAGATALERDFLRQHNVSQLPATNSLGTQLQWFLEFQKLSAAAAATAAAGGSARFPEARLFSKGLYVVGEVGGDDYEYMVANGWSYAQMHELVPLVVDAIAVHIRKLHEAGARRFLVPNIPLQGCSVGHLSVADPSVEKDEFGCIAGFNSVNYHHNALLKEQLDLLQKELAGSVIHYADFAGVYTAVLENPQAYGFPHPFVACCGTYTSSILTTVHCGESKAVNGRATRGVACSNASEFIYWNDGHFTDQFNKLVARKFLSSADYVRPPIRRWSDAKAAAAAVAALK